VHISIVLPLGHRFSADTASSISTCAHDFARANHHRARMTVLGSSCSKPFDDVAFVPLPDPPKRLFSSSRADYALVARNALAALKPDVVLVELDGRLASTLARQYPAAPIALRLHSDAEKAIHGLKGLRRRMRLASLAGLVCVSQSMAMTIDGALKGKVPIVAAPNGVDLELWRGATADPRKKTIVFAGRLIPEKGIVELCEAAFAFLNSTAGADWSAVFLVSDVDKNPDLDARCRAHFVPLGDRVRWLTNQHRSDVRANMQIASIVVVPSKVIEGFGMVAAEAHAAGCAVISSGLGGLRDASGDAALYLERVTSQAIFEALNSVSTEPDLSAWQAASRSHAEDSLGLDVTAATIHAFLATVKSRWSNNLMS
jgi:glycosyltransferase involved in cell wall biosynthesis